MFLDTLLEEDDDTSSMMSYMVEDARKVRIHPDVVDRVLDLVEKTSEAKIAKLAPYTIWPAEETWIEFDVQEHPGSSPLRVGFLFMGEKENKDSKSVTDGFGCVILKSGRLDDVRVIPVRFDMLNYRLVEGRFHEDITSRNLSAQKWLTPAQRWMLEEMRDESEKEDPIRRAIFFNKITGTLKPILFGVLAMMNSPKIIHRVWHDMDKLNKARVKRGKYPYHPHHEVRINIDEHIRTVSNPTGTNQERGQYFVRAHLRFLVHPRYKKVEVAIVRPHWRGNPEHGMRNTSYAVDREESSWVE